MLSELQSLAALASSEPEISVLRGESGCPWSFNWERRVITANPEDLELRPPDYCRGHLWILSDGETANPDEARRLLRSIRADGTRIHGLGLGEDSREIATLIPGSPTNLQPHQLPATFANLLRGAITKLPA